MRKDVDIRIEIVAGDPLWVVFLGRSPDLSAGSYVGHAFGALGSEDSGQNMSWQLGFGLYPLKSAMGGLSLVLGPVPGKVITESAISDVILSCRVSPSQFAKAKAVCERWATVNTYHLIYQDCVTYTFDLATALALKVPGRETFPDNISLPITLITKLAEINNTEDFVFGDWRSTDPAQRWNLLLGADTGTWTERNSLSASISAPARATRLGPRKFRIERDNTASILAFLGARPAVVQALLARGLRPSYMMVERTAPDTFKVDWFGLRWTLDAQNNLATVTQPGEGAPGAYTLRRRTS